MRLLDLQALKAATEKVVELPEGDVRIRRLGKMEYMRLLPQPPEGILPKRSGNETEEQLREMNEAAITKELEWIDSLEPAAKVAHRGEMVEALYVAVARAIIEPVMTVDQVKLLGDGAYTVFGEIQRFWEQERKAQVNGLEATPA